jgi:hypothetical protein
VKTKESLERQESKAREGQMEGSDASIRASDMVFSLIMQNYCYCFYYIPKAI